MQQGGMKGSKPGEKQQAGSSVVAACPVSSARLSLPSVAVQGLILQPWGVCIIACSLVGRTYRGMHAARSLMLCTGRGMHVATTCAQGKACELQ